MATILTVGSHSRPGRKRSPRLLSILAAAWRGSWPRFPWGVSMRPQQEGATRCPEGPELFLLRLACLIDRAIQSARIFLMICF